MINKLMIKTHTTLNQYLGFYTFIKPWFKFVSSLKRSHCCCSVAQSCPTLCNPLDYSPSGSSVNAILQARILKQVAISFSRGSSRPRDQTCVTCVSCIGRWIDRHEQLLTSFLAPLSCLENGSRAENSKI